MIKRGWVAWTDELTLAIRADSRIIGDDLKNRDVFHDFLDGWTRLPLARRRQWLELCAEWQRTIDQTIRIPLTAGAP